MNAMNYGNLFTITLPETILEVLSLLVLIVDLAWMRISGCSSRLPPTRRWWNPGRFVWSMHPTCCSSAL